VIAWVWKTLKKSKDVENNLNRTLKIISVFDCDTTKLDKMELETVTE
jgi:hypothetical protein